MEHGGSMYRRLPRVLAVGAATGVALALATANALPALRNRSQRALDERARRETTRTAQVVRAGLLTGPATTPGGLRQVAERVDGVRVLHVDGENRHAASGVRLLFQVTVSKTGTTLFGYQRAHTVACFHQVVNGGVPPALERVPCPTGPPPVAHDASPPK